MDVASTVSLLMGIIGTFISIYQAAVIRESKKRTNELQYVLAALSVSALNKQQAWQNQINLIIHDNPDIKHEDLSLHISARDGFTEIGNICGSLEGVFDTSQSAIRDMMHKSKEIVGINAELQAANNAQSAKV